MNTATIYTLSLLSNGNLLKLLEKEFEYSKAIGMQSGDALTHASLALYAYWGLPIARTKSILTAQYRSF